jgi:hypothetical protein
MPEITSPNSNTSPGATTTAFFTKSSGNYPIKKISEFEFVVEKDIEAEFMPTKNYCPAWLLIVL